VVDGDLRVRDGNRVFGRMVGRSRDDFAGRPLPEVCPQWEARQWELVRQVLATGEPVPDSDIRGTTAGIAWRERNLLAHHYPILDTDGTPVAVGIAVTDVTELRQAEAARDAVGRRLRMLGRASGVIGASLDLSASLDAIVDFVVPEFADTCQVVLADQSLHSDARPDKLVLRWVMGGLRQGVPAMPVGPRIIPVGEFIRYRWDSPPYRAFRERKPILQDLNNEVLGSFGTPAVARYFEEIGLRSLITVPLLVGDDFYGAMMFGTGISEPGYTEQDVQAAGELGDRVASAVANARAYARERAAAVTLQHGLLPAQVPAVEGLEIARRYEPGTEGTEVGGDWFDVIPLSAGRVALVIGDVMGRGLVAAGVMGQLRSAVRAFAALDLSAAEVLRHLDELVQGIGAGPESALVSAIYAVWEPATATVTVANAGHLPPVMRRPDGSAEVLERAAHEDAERENPGAATGMMLGVGGGDFIEVSYDFPAGSTLALFTDGIVESPEVDIDEGIRRLQATLADSSDLSRTADSLLRLIDRTGGYDDDAALLLVHAAAPTDRDTTVHIFPSDMHAAAAARKVAVETLNEWGLERAVFVTELLVSELVTNAIRYSAGPCRLMLRRGTTAIYAEVSDGDTRVPRLLHPSAYDEGGRGLQLVAELASSWGARSAPTGKTVWFRLDISDVGGNGPGDLP
jgi:serine phosphatase RsbU (regulator of sigma subunit)